jgi:hypothetical protein
VQSRAARHGVDLLILFAENNFVENNFVENNFVEENLAENMCAPTRNPYRSCSAIPTRRCNVLLA